MNSQEIKELPENDQLDVVDQVEEVIKELSSPATDDRKVVRGLKRLGNFISSVASQAGAEFVAQIGVAYARAHGLPIG